jgi:hypothetical protein
MTAADGWNEFPQMRIQHWMETRRRLCEGGWELSRMSGNWKY